MESRRQLLESILRGTAAELLFAGERRMHVKDKDSIALEFDDDSPFYSCGMHHSSWS